MSTETSKPKSPYQLRREAIDRAITAWQTQEVPAEPEPGGGRYVPLTLEDCLNDEGLCVLPRPTGHGKWVVEVDGERAPICPGSGRPAGLLDAEEAAELFLTLAAADWDAERQPTIRPATELEFKTALANHLFGGAA